MPVRRVASAQQGAPRGEQSSPVVRRRRSDGRTTSTLVGEQGGQRVGVPSGDRGVDAGSIRGRGVRSHPALALLRSSGWRGRGFAPPPARPSARRSGRAPRRRDRVELLDPRHEAIGAEDPEDEELPLVGAADRRAACRSSSSVRGARRSGGRGRRRNAMPTSSDDLESGRGPSRGSASAPCADPAPRVR